MGNRFMVQGATQDMGITYSRKHNVGEIKDRKRFEPSWISKEDTDVDAIWTHGEEPSIYFPEDNTARASACSEENK